MCICKKLLPHAHVQIAIFLLKYTLQCIIARSTALDVSVQHQLLNGYCITLAHRVNQWFSHLLCKVFLMVEI